ncbi:MAG: metal ABC transporter permease, partial [Caldilineaceae bacterium]|nr:metal ABC transporter permease [Caldilineaceae bacterium]
WAICINGRVIAQGPPVDVFTAETLSATYRGEMEVVRHNGMLLIYQKPHEHSLADVLPDPVPGHVPGDESATATARRRGTPFSPARTTIRTPTKKARPSVNLLLEPFQFEFFRNGTMAAVMAGGLCGLIGVYIVLRGMSYIGHGLSHAIFGGAVVAYVMSWNFYIGAGMWGFISALLINKTVRSTKINADAAIG